MNLRVLFVLFAVFSFQTVVHAEFVTGSSDGDLSAQGNSCNCTINPSAPVLNDKTLGSARMTRNSVLEGTEATLVSQVISDNPNWAPSCSRFAGGGEYGPLGQQIVEELASGEYPHLMNGTDDLRRLCPGFDDMTEQGKQGFIVTAMAAIAARESSCGEAGYPHRAIEGIAVGLYQLNSGKEDQFTQQTPGLQLCEKGDGKSEEKSVHCTLKILEAQLAKYGAFFSNKSYWQVIHPSQASQSFYKEIRSALASYPLCK